MNIYLDSNMATGMRPIALGITCYECWLSANLHYFSSTFRMFR